MAKLRPLLATLAAVACLGWGHASAARATFVLPNWFEWDTEAIDVFVLPPGHGQIINDEGVLAGGDTDELHPYANSYTRAIENSIRAWKSGIRRFGAAWLRTGLALETYVLGRDHVPAGITPEIVIVTDETKGQILGMAHDTRPCVVNNSKFSTASFTYADMYNINVHEFGHCLGLDHVIEPWRNEVIDHDVMAAYYIHEPGATKTHLHCVSNLDVAGVESAFAEILGQPGGGERVAVAPADYERITCARRDG